jgi:hypothetical protein
VEASGVSGMRGDEGYVRIEGLGVTGASLDKGTWEAIEEEPVLVMERDLAPSFHLLHLLHPSHITFEYVSDTYTY